VVEAGRRMQPRHPLEPGAPMGAMVDQVQMERVLGFIARGQEEGAKLALGGSRVMQDTGPQTNEQWWLGALLALALFVALWVVLPQVPVLQNVTTGPAISPDYLKQLGAGFVDPNQYLLPFELASVLLLVALVGSIVIAGEKQ